MVRRGVDDVLQGAHGANQPGVDPELVQRVELHRCTNTHPALVRNTVQSEKQHKRTWLWNMYRVGLMQSASGKYSSQENSGWKSD